MSGTESAVRRKAPTIELEATERAAPSREANELFETTPRGPQLEVGAADDAAEHAADRLADRVIARLRAEEAGHQGTVGGDGPGHEGPVYEGPGHEGPGHDGHQHGPARRTAGAVRRAVAPRVGREGGTAGAELSSRIEAMRGSGSSLDEGVRRRMGSAFGADLAGVRVHTDSRAADAAAEMGALAFTTGKDIFFGAGQYAPDTAEGEHVLAHELAHTVQSGGGTRRKVSRLWDFSKSKLELTNTRSITALKSRPVWFFEDHDGDRMVVKVENDLIGLGQLVGKMHKKLSGTSTVKYHKLSKHEAFMVDDMVDLEWLVDPDSWEERGRYVKQNDRDGVHDGSTDLEAAQAQAHTDIKSNWKLVAMSVAEGEGANELATPDKDGGSRLRSMLARPGHLRKLGELTATDLFMGNTDRVRSGNLGNWFYDPDGAMTVIDNVDSMSGMSDSFKAGDTLDSGLGELRTNLLRSTAESAVDGLRREIAEHDDAADQWFAEVLDSGMTREQQFVAELLEGLKEQRARLLRVFLKESKFRWSKSRRQQRSLKKAAKKAQAIDADENVSDYYTFLKARATYLKTR